jgi:hypothetical protein
MTILRPLAAGALLVAACVPSAVALQRLGWAYYPALQLEFLVRSVGLDWHPGTGQRTVLRDNEAGTGQTVKKKRKFRAPVNLAKSEPSYHPGDLYRPVNLIVYAGVIAIVVIGVGLVFWTGAITSRLRTSAQISPAAAVSGTQQDTGSAPETGPPARAPSQEVQSCFARPGGGWAMVAGLAAILLTLLQVRDAPDIRFILPALPLVLLPGALALGALSSRLRWLLPLFGLAAAIQAGAVLAKTYQLRTVPPAIREVIAFLGANRPVPPGIFMYPEGHYRLFPVRDDWYLGNRLQEFWESDNTARLAILRERQIGAIVVKTDRIGKLDNGVMNLGIYPDTFVRDIKSDPRFRKVFENRSAIVYTIEEAEQTATPQR